MVRNRNWTGHIRRAAMDSNGSTKRLAKELGLTLSQLQALALVIGDDRDSLRDAAFRLKGKEVRR